MSTAINSPIHPIQFSSEFQYDELRLEQFWQRVTQDQLFINPQISLAYCYIKHPRPNKTIVISNGRIESYLKYKEFIFDMYHLGYSIYAIDHRGQGLSSRLTQNPHQGHVEKFEDYIDDFECFIKQVVHPEQHEALFLVGHSMGSAIATLYLERKPTTFNAAVFSAPMYGIKLPFNKQYVYKLIKLLDNGSSHSPNYVLGGKNYHPPKFEKNELTHSRERYQQFRKLYQQQPELQLGSPTNRWLMEALIACEKAIVICKNSTIPILILQAEEDTVVDNQAQEQAVGQNSRLLTIANARHEIFIEQDAARNEALNNLHKFFQIHS